jgi:hypothetical protein
MHHIALHLMHSTMISSVHLCSYALDHVEPELEVQAGQAQVEAISNLALDQGKPRCI